MWESSKICSQIPLAPAGSFSGPLSKCHRVWWGRICVPSPGRQRVRQSIACIFSVFNLAILNIFGRNILVSFISEPRCREGDPNPACPSCRTEEAQMGVSGCWGQWILWGGVLESGICVERSSRNLQRGSLVGILSCVFTETPHSQAKVTPKELWAPQSSWLFKGQEGIEVLAKTLLNAWSIVLSPRMPCLGSRTSLALPIRHCDILDLITLCWRRSVLCTIEYLAVPLASTHYMPLAVSSCENKNSPQLRTTAKETS